MTKYFLIGLLLIGFNFKLKAQEIPQLPSIESIDSLKTTVGTLMKFYQAYEDGSSASSKKEKYNTAVDEISGGMATEKDKDDAFKVIDAYIKADNAPTKEVIPENPSSSNFGNDEAMNKQIEEVQAYVKQQDAYLYMSYPEFEAFMRKDDPNYSRLAIVNMYNGIHSDDGKAIEIDENDEELMAEKELLWAYDVLNNPKSCADLRKAIKILKFDIDESKIQEACLKIK